VKQCKGCRQTLPLDLFSKNAPARDGLQEKCKPCVSAYMKARHAANRERLRQQARDYYYAHRAEGIARAKAYAEANPEQARQWRRESCRRAFRRYPEKGAARCAVRYAVKVGKLVKPAVCSQCGGKKGRIEGHHYKGYAREHRLDVVWLCRPCHGAADAEQERAMKT